MPDGMLARSGEGDEVGERRLRKSTDEAGDQRCSREDLEQKTFDAQYPGCRQHSEIKSSISGRLVAIQG